MKNFKIEYIEWMDHCSSSNAGWKLQNDLDLEPMKIVSVGVVLKETKQYVVIAGTMDIDESNSTNHTYTCEMCILKKCIVRRETLKELKITPC